MPGNTTGGSGQVNGAAPFGAGTVQPPAAITVGGSPFTYTAGANIEDVHVQSPASTTTTVAKGGVTVANMITPAATTQTSSVRLAPGQSIVVTYTNLPVMVRDVP